METPSVLDDSIINRDIEDRHKYTNQAIDESSLDKENVQANINSQSHGEHAVTYERDNGQQKCDTNTVKEQGTIQLMDSIKKLKSAEPKQHDNASNTNVTSRVTR